MPFSAPTVKNRPFVVSKKGLAIGQRTHDSVDAAELYRLNGEVLAHKVKGKLRNANIAGAEACFQRAIQTARRQQAKTFELRATVSLCRLRRRMGKAERAKSKLAKVYRRSAEGFDTPRCQAGQSAA